MICIPMAGLSTRFAKEGYSKPKYELLAHGRTVFEWSLLGFNKYFKTELFVFITLKKHNAFEFIQKKCKELGIANIKIVCLENETKGQADTVYQGINHAMIDESERLAIFNIDTFRRSVNLEKLSQNDRIGHLETFIGSGKNWSNVVPDDKDQNRVKLTAEKKELSQYCCTGLYFWDKYSYFKEAFEYYFESLLNEVTNEELYVAPMYNYFIDKNKYVAFTIIDVNDVIFCGVPQEYEAVLKKEAMWD
ncbi:capsular biosynthesis protein [Alteromonas gracilis]|uniref:Capsular biosynthesis protein n=2 Tax=Alteromonas gracilis TaxID=1479524 RepID=A0ABX5CT97_9ALTE|nr:capsular biosynthesis protein [Alteromonas gracilis]